MPVVVSAIGVMVGTAESTVSARGCSHRLARPGTQSRLSRMVGMPRFLAAWATGTETYPPSRTTARTWCSWNNCCARAALRTNPLANFHAPIGRSIGGAAGSAVHVRSAARSMRASIARVEHAKCEATSFVASSRASAMANPGLICPPEPPPASTTVGIVMWRLVAWCAVRSRVRSCGRCPAMRAGRS